MALLHLQPVGGPIDERVVDKGLVRVGVRVRARVRARDRVRVRVRVS